MLKLMVHQTFYFTNNDAAFNIMDFMLVVLGMIEVLVSLFGGDALMDTAFLRVLRVFKVAKFFRMFRAIRIFSDIRVMMDCVAQSVSPLMWSIVLLTFLSSIFGVFFVQMLGGALEADSLSLHETDALLEYFGSVEQAMFSLLQATTGGQDWITFYNRLAPLGLMPRLAFVFYVLFMLIAVLNIVMSVFLDKVLNCAKPTLEALMLDKHYQDIKDAKELTDLVAEMDTQHCGVITFSDFTRYMHSERFRLYFDVRGITVKDTSMLFNMLAAASKTGDTSEDCEMEEAVDLHAFVTGCMRLKGVASCMDLYTLSWEVKAMRADQERFIEWSEQQFDKLNSGPS
jgi:hypothetical protein